MTLNKALALKLGRKTDASSKALLLTIKSKVKVNLLGPMVATTKVDS